MLETLTMPRSAAVAQPTSATRWRSIPWYLWCSALAVISAYIGGYWDIAKPRERP